jgi:hypothetical protein
MEDLLEPSPGNKFAALWTVACNYSTMALVLINAWNTFNALCYLLWSSAVHMRAFGCVARRRRLKSSRGTSTVPETKSAGVIRDSSNFVLYLQSFSKCCPVSNFIHVVFHLYKSFLERGMQLADTNCRGIQFGICCTKSGRASACY